MKRLKIDKKYQKLSQRVVIAVGGMGGIISLEISDMAGIIIGFIAGFILIITVAIYILSALPNDNQ